MLRDKWVAFWPSSSTSLSAASAAPRSKTSRTWKNAWPAFRQNKRIWSTAMNAESKFHFSEIRGASNAKISYRLSISKVRWGRNQQLSCNVPWGAASLRASKPWRRVSATSISARKLLPFVPIIVEKLSKETSCIFTNAQIKDFKSAKLVLIWGSRSEPLSFRINKKTEW